MKGNLIKAAQGGIVRVGKHGLRFTKKNLNWIFMLLGIFGVSGLAYTTITGTIKAVKLCEEKQVEGRKEIVKTVWRLYIPSMGFFILTTVSLAGGAKFASGLKKQLATMTGLYAMSQTDIKELKEKMKEVVGPKKAEAIVTEAEKERVRKLPPPNPGEIHETGHGDTLFQDWLTGQWFRASPDYIELVQEKLNNRLVGEIDGVMERGYMHEFFHLRSCGADELIWDQAEMLSNGYKEIKLDCTHTEWMEVNGKREMVCTMRCYPEASGF